MVVAQAGEADRPVRPAPLALRPLLRFAKLPTRALAVVRRAVESDAAFRAEVAAKVSPEAIGRPSWLFLARPDGWQEELEALAVEVGDAQAAQQDRRAEGDARRRLAAAEEAADRAREVSEEAERELARSVALLAEERRARREAVERSAALGTELDVVTAERDRALAGAADARKQAEVMRTELDSAIAEVSELRRVQALVPPPVSPPPTPTTLGSPVPVLGPGAGRPESSPPAVNPRASAALDAATDALMVAIASMRSAAAALRPPASGSTLGCDRVPEPAGLPASVPDRDASPGQAAPAPGPRPTPLSLPPAVYEESVEAARHLVRVQGMVMLIDGYNVSQLAWPALPISEQRRRLVAALGGLVARSGVDVVVVFDGSEDAWPAAVPVAAQPVRVVFSPGTVEADDVIVERARVLRLARPVLVASNDRAVRAGATRAGANVISSDQLLAILDFRGRDERGSGSS